MPRLRESELHARSCPACPPQPSREAESPAPDRGCAQPRRRLGGYTLIEVLVAAVILVVLLPALTRYVISARQTRQASAESEIATALAQRTLDSLAQVPAAARTGDGTASTITWQGRDFQVVWDYHDASAKAYTGTSPGAAAVEVSFAQGSARRRVQLDGVLP